MLKKLSANLPTLLLDQNPKRSRLMIQMQPTDVDPNNTGKVYIGFGFQPIATAGHASQGEVLIQSSVIDEPKGGEILNEKYKKPVWATADANNQTLIVEEETQ